MYDDPIVINDYKLKEYVDFLDVQCQGIKELCSAMESDIIIASAAMDTTNGKVVAKRVQNNIAAIHKNMPINTDVYDRLVLVRKKIKELIDGVNNGGGAGGNF